MVNYLLLTYLISIGFSNECHPICQECLQNVQTPKEDQCSKCHDGYYKVITWDTGENKYGECHSCPESCKLCTDKDYCTDCNPGYVLDKTTNTCPKCHESCSSCTGPSENQCSECSEGYFKIIKNDIISCIKCSDNCKVCENEEKCKDCKENAFITDNGKCSLCDISCSSCEQSEYNCIECNTGFYRHNDQCLSCNSNCNTCDVTSNNCTSCKEGHYLDKTTNTCNECYSSECKECSGPLQCTTCYDGYTTDPNGQKCEKCPEYCSNCKYLYVGSDLYCTECAPGYYRWFKNDEQGYVLCSSCDEGCSQCHDSGSCEVCKPGYYMSNEKVCYKCSENCLTCTENSEKCTSCHEGYYPKDNKCTKCTVENCHICASGTSCKECNDGFYLAGTGNCIGCPDNCVKCKDSDTCTVCKTGFYADSNGKCQTCKDNCDACNSTHCLDCAPEHYPLDDGSCSPCAPVCSECTGPSDKECIACDPGWYFSRPNRNCFKCHEACSACNGPNANDCSNCSTGYYMNEGKCTKCESGCEACENYRKCTKCQNGFYLVINNNDYDCEPCPISGCMDCQNEEHKCTKCLPGFYESYSTSGALSCKICNSDSTCKECATETGSATNVICRECFDGFYLNDANKCVKCGPTCSLCSSEDTCTKCADGYLLDNNACTTSCSPNCLSCEKTIDNCISCHKGFVLNGTSCIQCPTGCKTCEYQGSASICLECQDGYQKEGEICTSCHESCATCYSESYLACYTCAVGYYKYNVANWPDVYTGECRKCEEGLTNCIECSSECIDDNVDNNKPCGGFKCSKCGNGTYLTTEGDKCASCDSTCKTCFGPEPFHCTSCDDGFYVNESNRCVECDSSCATCEETPTKCTSCKSNFYLDKNTCVQCSENCSECENATSCTVCKPSFYFFQNKCHESCSVLGEGFINNDETSSCECKPGFVLNASVCDPIPTGCSDHHCSVEDNSEGTEYINYTFPLPEAKEYHNKESGGAVRAINVGFTAENTTFDGCYSENGGAGAIFIYNKIDSKESNGAINLKNVTFANNKGYFGGAVYIYHVSAESEILIQSCKFISNSLYEPSSETKLKGGSAIYITAKQSQIIDCLFKGNKGKGGTVKITDNTEEVPEQLRLLNNNNNKNRTGSFVSSFVLLQGCSFEIDKSSDCSLFCSNKNKAFAMSVEVKDCTFSGDLRNGAHHIDGQVAEKMNTRISVKDCKFDSDERSAVNKKFANIKLRDQKLNGNKFAKNDHTMRMTASSLAAAAVAIVVVAIIVIKKRKSDEKSDGNYEQHDTQNSTLI